ncbi:hypothetical protein [Candidatus Uabimicrobium amorphum]|uniref:Uncharacterized protein n=1 Tax=Uabimicrobium amorphum TaxID=2596890 RepID=A0A5S9F6J1_UABAM|nr:hypothetical protein [Candidatus Uabimicrobium amorphum]BBM86322.1 hypothetical protein UABAM_04708 [Candidatus Uabimicrobium amorphum]
MDFFSNPNITLIDKLIVFAYRNEGMEPEKVIRSVGAEDHIYYYNGYWTQYGEEITITRAAYKKVLAKYNVTSENVRENARVLSAVGDVSTKLTVLEQQVKVLLACIKKNFSMQLTFNEKSGREVVRISRKGNNTWIHLNEKENDWLNGVCQLPGWCKNGTYWTKTVQNWDLCGSAV